MRMRLSCVVVRREAHGDLLCNSENDSCHGFASEASRRIFPFPLPQRLFRCANPPSRRRDGYQSSARGDLNDTTPGRIRNQPPPPRHCEPVTDVTGVAIRFSCVLLLNFIAHPRRIRTRALASPAGGGDSRRSPARRLSEGGCPCSRRSPPPARGDSDSCKHFGRRRTHSRRCLRPNPRLYPIPLFRRSPADGKGQSLLR